MAEVPRTCAAGRIVRYMVVGRDLVLRRWVNRVVMGWPNVRTDASPVVQHAFGDPQCQFLFQILEVPLPILVCVVTDPEHHRILVWEPCHYAEGPSVPAIVPDDPSLVGG